MRSQFPLCYLQECSLEQHNEEINLPWQGKINEIRKQVKTSDFRCKEILKDINSVNDIFQELPKAMAGKIAKLINKNKKIAEDDHDSETKLALIQIKKKLSELDSAKQEISVMTQGVSSLKTELTRRFTLYKQNP